MEYIYGLLGAWNDKLEHMNTDQAHFPYFFFFYFLCLLFKYQAYFAYSHIKGDSFLSGQF